MENRNRKVVIKGLLYANALSKRPNMYENLISRISYWKGKKHIERRSKE